MSERHMRPPLTVNPALSSASQLALTQGAVGGPTTTEDASAFLVPEATMGLRISRAKQSIKNSQRSIQSATDAERAERLRVVLQVLLRAEPPGLLALMLLTDARRAARTNVEGWIVPLAEQQRELWNTAQRLAPVKPIQAAEEYALRNTDASWATPLAITPASNALKPSRSPPRGGGVPA